MQISLMFKLVTQIHHAHQQKVLSEFRLIHRYAIDNVQCLICLQNFADITTLLDKKLAVVNSITIWVLLFHTRTHVLEWIKKQTHKNILTVYIFSLSFSAAGLGGRGLFFVDGVSMMGVRCMSASSLPFFSSSVHKNCTSSSSICSWQAKNNNNKKKKDSTVIQLYTVHSHKTRFLSCSKPDKDILKVHKNGVYERTLILGGCL